MVRSLFHTFALNPLKYLVVGAFVLLILGMGATKVSNLVSSISLTGGTAIGIGFGAIPEAAEGVQKGWGLMSDDEKAARS